VIRKSNDFDWDLDVRLYKDTPGSHLYVTRREMFGNTDSTKFQVRYFEVAPGGYTSFEQHGHEHCVLVVRGAGRVRLGTEWTNVGLNDTVYVGPMTPHQFVNDGNEPFGILCIVDRERDRPTLLDSEGIPRTSD
jgi:quercetin dioxygenase-like cupin family protein